MAASLAEGNKERQSTATRLFMQLSDLKVKPEVVVVTVEDGLVDVDPRGITLHVYDYDEDGVTLR